MERRHAAPRLSSAPAWSLTPAAIHTGPSCASAGTVTRMASGVQLTTFPGTPQGEKSTRMPGPGAGKVLPAGGRSVTLRPAHTVAGATWVGWVAERPAETTALEVAITTPSRSDVAVCACRPELKQRIGAKA